MSIYSQLEKVAIDRMPRSQYSDAAIPYSERKKQYIDFITNRSNLPERDAAAAGRAGMVPGALIGGLGGGLIGLSSGGTKGAFVGGLLGTALGGGIGYLGGSGAASAQNSAIQSAKEVVKGGKYDKALQDEITNYRAVKRQQEEARQRAEDAERRRMHLETQQELRQIREAQRASQMQGQYGPSYGYSGRGNY